MIKWLENTEENWLIVVDNYDQGNIIKYLPGNGKGNILFTGRSTNPGLILPPEYICTVPLMNVADSTLLLFRTCYYYSGPEHEPQARVLVEELGYLPIAIANAGATIRMRCCPIEKYITELRNEKKKLLGTAPRTGDQAAEKSVYATFELSWNYINSIARGSSQRALASQCALQILNTFCFFHRKKIPGEVVIRARFLIGLEQKHGNILSTATKTAASGPNSTYMMAEGAGAAWMGPNAVLGVRSPDEASTDSIYHAAIVMLTDISLLEYAEFGRAIFSMHPLVHSWLRDRMLPGSFDRNLRLARSTLCHSFCPNLRDYAAEKFHAELLPHFEANSTYHFKGTFKPGFYDQLDFDLTYAQVVTKSRLWDEAIALRQRIVDFLISGLDRDDPETLKAMIELGKAYLAAAKVKEAEEVLLQVFERTLSCPSPTQGKVCYVDVCVELSMVYLLQTKYTMAKFMAEEAWDRGKMWKTGRQHAKLSQVCLVYQYLERWEDAIEVANELFKFRLRKALGGPEHHLTLKVEAEMACMRARLGDVDLAEKVLVPIAKKFEEEFGKDHYDTLVARTNLAWVCFLKGRLGEAEEIQREVLKTGREILGPRDLYTLYMMFRLGLTLGESGKYGEAIKLLTECAEGRKELLSINLGSAVVELWISIFTCRMNGVDYTAEMPSAKVEEIESGLRQGDYPFAPVTL